PTPASAWASSRVRDIFGDARDAADAERAHRARGDPRRRADLPRRDLAPGGDLQADRVAGAALAARGPARARGRWGCPRALRRNPVRGRAGGAARART